MACVVHSQGCPDPGRSRDRAHQRVRAGHCSMIHDPGKLHGEAVSRAGSGDPARPIDPGRGHARRGPDAKVEWTGRPAAAKAGGSRAQSDGGAVPPCPDEPARADQGFGP
jgi:hypothetical protein